ncbi:DUF58 domain-containing protein [Haloarchaeobius sp. HRN-SO-5]|uniref:DUF58 domain-containing protein n=1 Tax=Haloarchaeobius sp. HRN-SO-5 TaxID=3446118 RepID=UPI003EBF866D
MSEFHETNRWRGVLAFSLLAVVVALGAKRPSLLVLAAIGVVFSVYPSLSPTWRPELVVSRSLSDPSPKNGERVTVETTVQNVGDRPILDLRFVDGVPPALSVVGDSPRRGAVLRPGGEFTYTYEIEAKRGKHHFQPATAVVRDVSGGHELETTVVGETEIDCTADLDSSPLRPQTLDYVGRVLSDQVGRGIEFDRTREYKHGDEKSRIDWKRFARTNELTTIEFRTERSVNVIVLVDARSSAYHSTADDVHAVGLCVSAAEQLLVQLLGDRNQAGVAAFGRELCWVAPNNGRDHLVRTQQTLATHPAFHPVPPANDEDADHQFVTLRERLPDAAQIILLSPLCDDWIVTAARRLDAYGYPVSIVSPDVVESDTLGRRLASIERSNRITSLRAGDIPIVEWDPDVPLGRSVEATQTRWLS